MVIDVTGIFISERPEAAAITAAINRVGRTLRGGGGPVLWVRPAPFEHPDLLGAASGHEAAVRQQSAAGALCPDGRLWPALDVQPGDLHAKKSLYSAFFPGASDIMLCDACFGSSPEAHANALAAVFRNFGDVRSSEELIQLLTAPR